MKDRLREGMAHPFYDHLSPTEQEMVREQWPRDIADRIANLDLIAESTAKGIRWVEIGEAWAIIEHDPTHG